MDLICRKSSRFLLNANLRSTLLIKAAAIEDFTRMVDVFRILVKLGDILTIDLDDNIVWTFEEIAWASLIKSTSLGHRVKGLFFEHLTVIRFGKALVAEVVVRIRHNIKFHISDRVSKLTRIIKCITFAK